MNLVLLLAALAAAEPCSKSGELMSLACSSPPPTTVTNAAPAWKIYDVSGALVFQHKDLPGLVFSAAGPEAGPPWNHPHVAGSSLRVEAEAVLQPALAAASSALDLRRRLSAAGFLILPADAPGPLSPGASWEARKKGKAALRVRNEPGPIVSRAEPPPGAPGRHPFLSVSSLDAVEEATWAPALRRSRSVTDFLLRLQRAGYELTP